MSPLADDPLWFRDAVIYEVPVRAFHDSNDDGIGDFRGLMEKLDYVQDIGVTAIWLLPFYPSPLRDGGYDIADYVGVNPDYGTLKDFKTFLREAHARGIRVITELVINHTSNEHPWFARARRAPVGSRYRDFYVWSDAPDRYADARIIFQDFETSNWTWDPVAGQYFWHRFYSHQPDLNFENPAVHRAVTRALDFWLGMGVDGLRLDAIPYLYEAEGTDCENLPRTHEFLRALRAHVDANHRNRMLLAEANQWPEDAAAYFGAGDECHMNFHFPLMPRMFMSVELENSFPIIDILQQTPEIPTTCQWATFLRNHDELTLEMVTDEDRDYMYRAYAKDPRARVNLGIRRRLAPLMGVRRKIELMNGLLFSLPGTPVVYYGDEIGMGDNIYLGDRDGVRTPMQWSSDRNAGFSRANPQKLYLPVIIDPEYHFEAVNVEAQQNNAASLLWWMKRLIAVRKEHPVFGRGDIHFLHPENGRVLAFLRRYGDDRLLVVANLSRFAQHVELELPDLQGLTPVELFGRSEFPPIHDRPYPLSLAPHSFFWFSLEAHAADAGAASISLLPEVEAADGLEALLASPRRREALAALLPAYVAARRWFRAKTRRIKSVRVTDRVRIRGATDLWLTILAIEIGEEGVQHYVLPLGIARGAEADALLEERRHLVIARVTGRRRDDRREGEGDGVLYDAVASPAFARAMLALAMGKRSIDTESAQIAPTQYLRFSQDPVDALVPHLGTAEQTNTSIVFGDRYVLKLYRQLEAGTHPELELGRFLNGRSSHVAPLYGSIGYSAGAAAERVLGVVQGFVPNHGDAWSIARSAVDSFLERIIAHTDPGTPPAVSHLGRPHVEPDDAAAEALGAFPSLARLLGQRTAELHLCLASAYDDPTFAPEPSSLLHQRALYQSARAGLAKAFDQLRRRLGALPAEAADDARALLDQRATIEARLRAITRHKLDVVRIRCHGDYHLGQVLHAGSDFVIIDFEGEPARPIGERRFKRMPFRDVAGMLRSFQYAGAVALREGAFRPEDLAVLEPWADAWSAWIGSAFLDAYLETTGKAPFIPSSEADLRTLMSFTLFEKCIYELSYELDNRPEWVPVPIKGLRTLLREGGSD